MVCCSMKKFDQLVSQMTFVRQCVDEFDYSAITTVTLTSCFNLLFELAWKTLKEYMSKELLISDADTGSVKSIIRVAYREGLIADCELWLKMAKDRNDSTHHYCEAESIIYAESIIEMYLPLIEQLIDVLSKEISVSDAAENMDQIKEFCKVHSITVKSVCEKIMQEQGVKLVAVPKVFNSMSNAERLLLLQQEMKWENLHKDILLSPTGMGIVFYSEAAVKNIPIGEDFLKKEYWKPEHVAAHLNKGDIVGICTEGDADTFALKFRSGHPDKEIMEKYPAHAELGIEVMGDRIHVIDLYWLMDWQNNCPAEQQVELEPGFYIMTFCGEPPASVMGDELTDEEFDEWIEKPRVIYVFLNKVEAMPEYNYKGIPNIYGAYED